MKCCASPTTSIVERPSRAREAAVAFEALLFAQALKPLSRSLGFYGDAALDACAGMIARGERGGLTDRLERLFALRGRA